MKHTFAILIIINTLVLGACGESDDGTFVNPTGKGTIRMINAIKAAPDINLLIERKILAGANFRSSTNLYEYDDLDYQFNFEVRYAGNPISVPFSNKLLKINANTEYTLLVSGSLDNPLITVWEFPNQSVNELATSFNVRFAHTAESYGNLDYYFSLTGIAPASGDAIGNIAFGEIISSMNFDAGDYTLTLTEEGLPNNIVFQSDPFSFQPGKQYTVTPFDGGENTTAPIIVKYYSTSSGIGVHDEGAILDLNYPSTSEFVHASLEMSTVDIYDEQITATSTPWAVGHNFKDITNEVLLPIGSDPFIYVPSGLLAPELINFTVDENTGIRARTFAVGKNNVFTISTYLPDRRPLSTAAKLEIYNTNTNFESIDIYVIEADTLVDDQNPTITGVSVNSTTGVALLPPDSYDIYVTETSEKNILSGPIRLDIEIGDVFSGIIYDEVDPSILELILIQENQTP
ncbi:MAG: hypothetical protein CMQ54_05380 [Gammaproteobacteria bacterium]|nr:hypothetical protein [Gammaproteobacteria bacterium]|tara:strand:- start:882 stop:2261 length:1380 start_codon:yes stop_codon:yes gene_type:complete